MTPATRRRTVVPRWLVALLVGVGVVALVVSAWMLLTRPEPISVTSVEGLDGPVARSRLAQQGLLMTYGDARFSGEVPEGGVLEQDPAPGDDALPGTVVVVVVSAGADTFDMPDLVGRPVEQARNTLESRGAMVEIEASISDAEPGTVIASSPSPGVEIRTGSVVRLTVSGALGDDVLLPADLSGQIVLLDPAPPAGGTADVPLELTRNLRALLEASGANVFVTRSVVETAATDAMRAAWAQQASATIALGLDMDPEGSTERRVSSLPATPERADYYLASIEFSGLLVDHLTDAGESASRGVPEEDAVLAAAGCQAARVFLGDPSDPVNVETFSDPVWIDRVARALYRAVVEAVEVPVEQQPSPGV